MLGVCIMSRIFHAHAPNRSRYGTDVVDDICPQTAIENPEYKDPPDDPYVTFEVYFRTRSTIPELRTS